MAQISDLLEGVDTLEIQGDVSGEASGLFYDSRKCEEGSLFVAVSGARFDGHDFVPEAVKRGARYVVCDREAVPRSLPATCIRVRDSRLALAILARNFYGDPSRDICLIGVTGTNGKTTITFLLESILTAAGCSVGVLGTVNYRYAGRIFPALHTTPESLDLQKMLREMVDAGVTHVVMEVSSHAIDLKRVYGCSYDVGVFTNLSSEHLDYHRTMGDYFRVKKRFFDDVIREHPAVVNGDNPWGLRLFSEIRSPVVTFGFDGSWDVSPADASLSPDGIDAKIRHSGGEFAISSPLTGRFNLSNILASSAAAMSIGIGTEDIRAGIKALEIGRASCRERV